MDIEQQNEEIARIIDETIEKYNGDSEILSRNSYPGQDSLDNKVYNDEFEQNLVFEGRLQEQDYMQGKAQFQLMDRKYFNLAVDIAQKVEAKLGLEVILDTQYHQDLDK